MASISGNLDNLHGTFSTDNKINRLLEGRVRFCFALDPILLSYFSALKLQNAVKTSSDQIREDQIGRQLSRQRSSLDRIQQSSNVRQLSNDLQNLQRGIGASSRARTHEKVLEESNKFTQQGLEQRAFSSNSNINTLIEGKIVVC